MSIRNLYVFTFGWRKADGDMEAGSLTAFADSEEQATIAALVALEKNEPGYAEATVKNLSLPNLVSREHIKEQLCLVDAPGTNGDEGLDYVA